MGHDLRLQLKLVEHSRMQDAKHANLLLPALLPDHNRGRVALQERSVCEMISLTARKPLMVLNAYQIAP